MICHLLKNEGADDAIQMFHPLVGSKTFRAGFEQVEDPKGSWDGQRRSAKNKRGHIHN